MAKEKLNYTLKSGARPAGWQLPIKNVMLNKYVDKVNKGQRSIEYVPGQESIFKEDHAGDEEPVDVWFEDGSLQVSEDNIALAEILKRHPWNGIHFELVDHDVTAQKDLDKMELRVKAYEKVSSKDKDEMRARAFVLLGPYVISQSDRVVESQLKQLAMDDPEAVLKEMKNPDYEAKTVGALAVLRGALVLNPTNTQVSWGDTGKQVISVAAGQDPITKLGQFLSGKDEDAKLTLQEIGEKIKRSYERKTDFTADKEIEKLSSDNDTDSVASQSGKSSEELDIEEARVEFEAIMGKQVPNNKKNDLDWIQSKIKEGPEQD
jgi:hypothetical protein